MRANLVIRVTLIDEEAVFQRSGLFPRAMHGNIPLELVGHRGQTGVFKPTRRAVIGLDDHCPPATPRA